MEEYSKSKFVWLPPFSFFIRLSACWRPAFAKFEGMFRDHVYLLQAPEGESQPSTEVDLFISTEKIMVLNTDLKVSRALLFMFVLCLQDF